MKWRARVLANGIRGLLGGQDDDGAKKLANQIYSHPLIRGLHRDHDRHRESDSKKPSHIPARLFTMALLDIALRPAGDTRAAAAKTLEDARATINGNRELLGGQVTGALLAFVDQAEQQGAARLSQLQTLQSNVEGWFNDAMERVGGWYKRRTQLIGFLIGVLLVTFGNIDSIRIARVLANNPVLRASLIAEATRATAAGLPEASPASAPAPQAAAAPAASSSAAPAPGALKQADPPKQADDPMKDTQEAFKKLEANIAQIHDLGIPMGWHSENDIPKPNTQKGISWWIYKIGGLLLTALAASMGAPFWFSLLQKVISLRSGKPPEPAPAPAPAKASEAEEAA